MAVALTSRLVFRQSKGIRPVGFDFMEEQPAVLNEVSDETGQFDPRFVLWRKFCADRGIPVDSLPSNLSGELKEQWEKLKGAGPGDGSGNLSPGSNETNKN